MKILQPNYSHSALTKLKIRLCLEQEFTITISYLCHEKKKEKKRTWSSEHNLISGDDSEFLAGVVPPQKPALGSILVLGCLGVSDTSEITAIMLPCDWEVWRVTPIPELRPPTCCHILQTAGKAAEVSWRPAAIANVGFPTGEMKGERVPGRKSHSKQQRWLAFTWPVNDDWPSVTEGSWGCKHWFLHTEYGHP